MRVGGTKPIKIDVRIIAATNRNLEDMVKNDQFREDLYYRLTVFPISIPPLRFRKKDITPLALSFLGKLNQKYNFKKRFSNISIQLLNEYPWPGNIREPEKHSSNGPSSSAPATKSTGRPPPAPGRRILVGPSRAGSPKKLRRRRQPKYRTHSLPT